MRINLKLHLFNLVIFLLLLISCNKKLENLNHQTKIETENEISEKIIYDFVNEILSQNETSEFCKNVIDRKNFIAINGDSIFIEKFKNEFNEKDLEFMRNQYLIANKFIWKNKLKNRQIIKLDTTINNDISREKFWNKTLEEYGCISYMNIRNLS